MYHLLAWTGFGWLGYVIILGAFVATHKLLDAAFGPGFCRQNSPTLAATSWVAGSLLCWPVGRYFNRDLPLRVFDADWARRGRSEAHSTLFVRLEFAGLVGLPFHVLIAVTGLD
jgi:hypothetical protein